MPAVFNYLSGRGFILALFNYLSGDDHYKDQFIVEGYVHIVLALVLLVSCCSSYFTVIFYSTVMLFNRSCFVHFSQFLYLLVGPRIFVA